MPGGEIERDGFAMLPGLLTEAEVGQLRTEVARLQAVAGRVCVRDVLRRSSMVAERAAAFAGGRCPPLRALHPVRGLIFDKTPGENWPVGWHQDRSIAVAARAEVGGYSAWTVKGGVQHVQAPAGLLEQMVTLRLHLDETPCENGALRVAPRTHRSGTVEDAEIPDYLGRHGVVTCACRAGDGLLMKPLLLHSSSRARATTGNQHRRVIHLEFAPCSALADGLAWYEASPSGLAPLSDSPAAVDCQHLTGDEV